jgi:hypothetical protein
MNNERLKILGLGLGLALLCITQVHALPDLANVTLDFPDIQNGTFTSYWFDPGSAVLNIWGFIYSLVLPFIQIFGYWVFAIIWFIYLGGVYWRAGDVTLPLVIGMISGSVMGIILPVEAQFVGIILFALGLVGVTIKYLIERL